MKILIISRSFYPGISPRSFRTTELVKEFSARGDQVTLLTHKNREFHDKFESDYNVVIKDLGNLLFPHIKLGKNKYKNLVKRLISRSLNLLFDYPDIELMFQVNKALKKEFHYDLLISIAVPHSTHWGVALSKRNDVATTWVADCGDPYMGASSDSFKRLFYFKYIEKWWSKKADFITIPLEGARSAYYQEFQEKIKIIPQGFNFEKLKNQLNQYVKNDVPTFAYSGLFIPKVRDPKPLIEYLLKTEVDFKFIIFSKQENNYRELVKKAKGKVEFRKYLGREELLQVLAKMDFLINFENKVSTQSPSKLIDYYFTGRPVLSIDSYNFDKLIVEQFICYDFTNKYVFKDMDKYNIKNVCDRFIELSK